MQSIEEIKEILFTARTQFPVMTGKFFDENQSVRWLKNGLLHKEDGPAVITKEGSKFWYKNNRLHRIDGPAVETYNNLQGWYVEGELCHSLDEYNRVSSLWKQIFIDKLNKITIKDSALIAEFKFQVPENYVGKTLIANQYEIWFKNGQVHRIEGPAFVDEFNNHQEWIVNGKLHRLNGPAYVLRETKLYFIHGKEYKLSEFETAANQILSVN